MFDSSFIPFPILVTERLILRQLAVTDAEAIFAHRNDDRVNIYLDDFRHIAIEQTQAFIERVNKEISIGKTILWVITQKDDDKFIGTICFWNILKDEHKAETGYTLNPAFHGKGYMNEAMARVIDFGFNKMKLITIEAFTHKDNSSSVNLLLRNGFKQDTMPDRAVADNRIFFTLSNS